MSDKNVAQEVEIIHKRDHYGFGIRLDNLEQVFIPSHIAAQVAEGDTITCAINENYNDKTGRTPWFAVQRIKGADEPPKMVPVVDYTAPPVIEVVYQCLDDMPLLFTTHEVAERMNVRSAKVSPYLKELWKQGKIPYRLSVQRADTTRSSYVIWCKNEDAITGAMRGLTRR